MKRTIIILIITVTFMSGCEIKHAGIIEGVNISGITIKATIDGDRRTIAPNNSKVWTIKLDDVKTGSGKLETVRGRIIFEGDITIKKEERIRLTFDGNNVVRTKE